MSLLIAEGLDWMTFKGPFQPKLFYDAMKKPGLTVGDGDPGCSQVGKGQGVIPGLSVNTHACSGKQYFR